MVEIRIAHASSTVDAAKPLQQMRVPPHAKESARSLHSSFSGPLSASSPAISPNLSRSSSAAELVERSLEAGGLSCGFRIMPVDAKQASGSVVYSYSSRGGTDTPAAAAPAAASASGVSAQTHISRHSSSSQVSGVSVSAAKDAPPSVNEVVFGFVTFVFCGIASLVCWQSLLGMLPYIELHAYNGAPYGNSILGIYQLGCICVQIVFILFMDAMKPSMIIAAIVCDATLAAILPLVLTGCTYTLSLTCFHIIALGFGICAGIISGGSIALASSIPFGFIGAFSMGQGVCGIVAFIVNLLASRYLFDLSTYEGAKRMFWLVFGASSAVSLLSTILLTISLRQPSARAGLRRYWVAKRSRAAAAAAAAAAAEEQDSSKARCGVWSLSCACSPNGNFQKKPVEETPWRGFLRRWRGTHAAAAEAAAAVRAAGDARTQELVVIGRGIGRSSSNNTTFSSNSLWRAQPEEAEGDSAAAADVDESTLPSRGWRAILSASWVYLLCIFLNFVLTLNLYPRVGPISWNYTGFSDANEQYIILFGVFCFGDFVGKSLPDISRYKRMQWLRLSKRGLVFLVFGRYLLAVLFILGMVKTHHPLLNAFPWYIFLMAALAITSGCCATTGIMHACESVPRFEEKEVVGPAAVLMILLGIACGVYSAYIY